jgi:ATP-binding cassette subfamily B protein
MSLTSRPGGPTAPRLSKLRLIDLLRPHWVALTLALLAVLGDTAADVLQPWPIKIVIDNVLLGKKLTGWLGGVAAEAFKNNRLGTLNFAVSAVVIIAVVGAVCAYCDKVLTTSVGQWLAHDLRRMLYHQMQRFSLAEHKEASAGDWITRVTKDIDTVQDFITTSLLGLAVSVLTIAGMLGVMFYVNWRFTLVALSVAPVLGAVSYVYTRRIKKAARAVRQKESELLAGVAAMLSTIHVVQAFAREDYEDRRFDGDSRAQVAVALEARGMKARLSPLVEVIVAVGTALVLAYGGRLALAGRISPGDLWLFLLYLGKMYKPMRDLSKMTDGVSRAIIGFERIQETLLTESRVRDLPDAHPAPPFQGGIEFDRVSFGYSVDAPLLKELSFRIEPGQVAAIVGPSGAGKSTIVSLISRFYDPLSGQVRIDGADIRRFTLKSLRDQISFVLQDTLLFRATIWENITYGSPTATIEDTVRAAELANAHEFILSMPLGYATMVGDRGATLSGGQRQRIAIARAIVRNAPILILDEPTVGLDAASEQAVIEGLDHLMKGRTTIVIAHDLATIRHADVIFVLKGAEIVESGTHDGLLARGGLYAELHRIQATEADANAAT